MVRLRSNKYIEHQKKVYELHKPMWNKLMKALGTSCNRCKSKDKLVLHHNRYVLSYDLKYLELLCKICHNKHHKNYNRIRKDKWEDINIDIHQQLDSLRNRHIFHKRMKKEKNRIQDNILYQIWLVGGDIDNLSKARRDGSAQ